MGGKRANGFFRSFCDQAMCAGSNLVEQTHSAQEWAAQEWAAQEWAAQEWVVVSPLWRGRSGICCFE
ncbi:hypothetical protein CUJ84_Chr000833 [Rhizobium leguminosarum]|uniref:Uncharacterized protein n=1 Tax=Rhizobium leguminosarum TaxID=384 RepID=A0A2K9YZ30_RHILE|nr:hypothetical protein CUJ84_Chr000833 [Rhizobium leguminosarum]